MCQEKGDLRFDFSQTLINCIYFIPFKYTRHAGHCRNKGIYENHIKSFFFYFLTLFLFICWFQHCFSYQHCCNYVKCFSEKITLPGLLSSAQKKNHFHRLSVKLDQTFNNNEKVPSIFFSYVSLYSRRAQLQALT